MSFTKEDEKTLIQLFQERDKCEKDSDAYFKYRDQIYALSYSKLADLFDAMMYEWKMKYKLDNDDGASIINDGLLQAVTKYCLSYNGQANKFVTYLIHIMNNLVKNYIVKRSAKKRIPTPLCINLDEFENYETKRNDEENLDPAFFPIVSYLTNRYDYFEATQNTKFFIEHFVDKLPDEQKFIVNSILEGHTLKFIAEKLNITSPGVRFRLKKLAKKLKLVENTLCTRGKL